MRKLTFFISLFLSGVVITGCSNKPINEFENVPAQELYNKGQSYLESGDYNNAIRHLAAVDIQADGGAYGEQIQLSLIYAQYKLGEYYKALDEAERFVRSYPNSSSMDYVYYLAGLSNVRLGDNWIQDVFGVNRSSRSIANIRNAYGSFQTIAQQFPQSKYAGSAKEWTEYLLNRLAEYELNIAEFYMERDAYVAVTNRIEDMIRFYPESKPTADALPLLRESFEAMGINDSAQKVTTLIEMNKDRIFPGIIKPAYGEQF